jgi:hypothetical protein
LFSEKDTAISFDHKGSINVNFLFYPETQKKVIVKIPLHLVGTAQNRNRYYSVSIVTEGKNKTTARENIHYEKLKNKYFFKQDVYNDTLRIVILRKDESLKNKDYKLVIKLEETKDFKLGISRKRNNQHQMIITINENFNVPPVFWKNYMINNGPLSASKVGPYHPKKCQKFVKIAGIKDENWRAEYNFELKLIIKKTEEWFKNHEILDENGNRLFFGNNEEEDDW